MKRKYICIQQLEINGFIVTEKYIKDHIYTVEQVMRPSGSSFILGEYGLSDYRFFRYFIPLEDDINFKINRLLEYE